MYADVLLATLGFWFDLEGKTTRQKEGMPNQFIDPRELTRHLKEMENDFEQPLQAQEHQRSSVRQDRLLEGQMSMRLIGFAFVFVLLFLVAQIDSRTASAAEQASGLLLVANKEDQSLIVDPRSGTELAALAAKPETGPPVAAQN